MAAMPRVDTSASRVSRGWWRGFAESRWLAAAPGSALLAWRLLNCRIAELAEQTSESTSKGNQRMTSLNTYSACVAIAAAVTACGGAQSEPNTPDGPMEEAGEEVDEAAEDVEEGAEEGVDETGDAVGEAGNDIDEETEDTE
jgi:hypothetical protein